MLPRTSCSPSRSHGASVVLSVPTSGRMSRDNRRIAGASRLYAPAGTSLTPLRASCLTSTKCSGCLGLGTLPTTGSSMTATKYLCGNGQMLCPSTSGTRTYSAPRMLSWLIAVSRWHRRMSFFDIVVPTQDTVRYNAVFEALVAISRPIFVTGVTGTGKTVVVQVRRSLHLRRG